MWAFFFVLLALDNIAEHHFVNEAMIAWVDNMAARDERATEEGTFNNGRFEHPHRKAHQYICEDLVPLFSYDCTS